MIFGYSPIGPIYALPSQACVYANTVKSSLLQLSKNQSFFQIIPAFIPMIKSLKKLQDRRVEKCFLMKRKIELSLDFSNRCWIQAEKGQMVELFLNYKFILIRHYAIYIVFLYSWRIMESDNLLYFCHLSLFRIFIQ